MGDVVDKALGALAKPGFMQGVRDARELKFGGARGLRDQFAMAAMTGLLASETCATVEDFTKYSFRVADAMLAESNRRDKDE